MSANRNVLTYEGLQYFYSKLSTNLMPLNTYLKIDGSVPMSGNLTVTNYLYPSVMLKPTHVEQNNLAVFEGSYVGSASFGIWEDGGGSNRRILEVNSKAFKNDLDDALYLRVAENDVYTSYKIYHEGMSSGIPVEKGGTGAICKKTARINLLVNGTNPITSNLEDTNSYWGDLGGLSVSYFNSPNQLNEQPSQVGALINCSYQTDTNLSYQLWGAEDGQLYHRNSTETGWHSSWVQVLDESNFSSVISLASLGGVSYTTITDLNELL